MATAQKAVAAKVKAAVKANSKSESKAKSSGNGPDAAPVLAPKKCASAPCGKKFTPGKEWQEYCSPTCSNRERGRRERARYREMRERLAKIDKPGTGRK